jgi:hypothetical protein
MMNWWRVGLKVNLCVEQNPYSSLNVFFFLKSKNLWKNISYEQQHAEATGNMIALMYKE